MKKPSTYSPAGMAKEMRTTSLSSLNMLKSKQPSRSTKKVARPDGLTSSRLLVIERGLASLLPLASSRNGRAMV